MVAALDGAARLEGKSQPLSSDADMRIFGVLRALADVVVVGAETVRQEGYRPARARDAFAARRAARRPAAGRGDRGGQRAAWTSTSPPRCSPSRLVPTLVLTGAGLRPGPDAGRGGGRRRGGGGRARAPGSTRPRRCANWRRAGWTRLLTRGRPAAAGAVRGGRCAGRAVPDRGPAALFRRRAPRIMDGPALAVPERMRPVSHPGGGRFPVHPLRTGLIADRRSVREAGHVSLAGSGPAEAGWSVRRAGGP